MSKQKKTTFSISILAAQLEVSPSTIRFYEEKGLISPDRTAGNQRVYTKKNRARLKLILRGKRFGFSLDEIAEMIGMADSEINELEQIENSLSYIDKKFEELKIRKHEIRIIEKDLRAVRAKLSARKKELE